MSSHSLSLRKMKLLLLPHGCLNSCLLVLKTPNQILFLTQQSSNINEVIRAVLNFFFILTKRFYTHKKPKRHKKHKKQKAPKSTKKLQKHQKHKKVQKLNQLKAQNANKQTKTKNALKNI